MHAAVFRMYREGQPLAEIAPATLGKLYMHQRSKELEDLEAWLLGEEGEHAIPYMLPARVMRITSEGIVLTGVERLGPAPNRMRWAESAPQKWVCWIRAQPFDVAPKWPVK